MQARAKLYTIGGLTFSGVLLSVSIIASVVCVVVGKTNYFLWGLIPYQAYLFLLNALPVEYPSGKTDALVYRGIKKGFDAEKVLLSAMEIQGRLYEGKSFSEIEESYYYDLPVLCEDEPLFAVMLDLRYRYHLERNELEKATACINRLATVQDYLAEEEIEKIAAELVYLHSSQNSVELAEESGKLCADYLKGNSATAKRVLAAFSLACGKCEAVIILLEQAEEALKRERLQGFVKFEKILLHRIKKSFDGE